MMRSFRIGQRPHLAVGNAFRGRAWDRHPARAGYETMPGGIVTRETVRPPSPRRCSVGPFPRPVSWLAIRPTSRPFPEAVRPPVGSCGFRHRLQWRGRVGFEPTSRSPGNFDEESPSFGESLPVRTLLHGGGGSQFEEYFLTWREVHWSARTFRGRDGRTS